VRRPAGPPSRSRPSGSFVAISKRLSLRCADGQVAGWTRLWAAVCAAVETTLHRHLAALPFARPEIPRPLLCPAGRPVGPATSCLRRLGLIVLYSMPPVNVDLGAGRDESLSVFLVRLATDVAEGRAHPARCASGNSHSFSKAAIYVTSAASVTGCLLLTPPPSIGRCFGAGRAVRERSTPRQRVTAPLAQG